MIIWKPIEGYEGLYEVSSSGLVRSVDCFYKTGQYYVERFKAGKILAPKKDKDGYRSVTLYKDGVKHCKRVSRLVCTAFHSNPENKPVVNHKNGDTTCDFEWNVEWATQSENILHSYRVLKRKSNPNMTGRIGVLSPFAKPLYQFDKDGSLIKEWGSMGEAVMSGFSRSKLKAVVNGSQKHHKGFIWSR